MLGACGHGHLLTGRSRIVPVESPRLWYGVARRQQARRVGPMACLQSEEARPLIKMCGITSPEDAAAAATAGANYVGMIVWPKSKRSVSVSLAREIAAAARENGAEPVGVFVDESAAEIEKACSAADLAIAQVGS